MFPENVRLPHPEDRETVLAIPFTQAPGRVFRLGVHYAIDIACRRFGFFLRL